MTRLVAELDLRPGEWMIDANCTDPSIDPEWFFPETRSNGEGTTKIALGICESCPVKRECLEFAMTNWPVHGIWGGVRNKQLQQLAKGIKRNNERSNNN